MPLPRRLDTIDWPALEALVSAGAQEDRQLEFKRDLYGKDDKSKKELLKDVSSFANASGGDIVFGVTDNGKIEGVDVEDFDELQRCWSQILDAGLDPRLNPKATFRAVAIPDKESKLVVLRVPRSLIAPHMVKESGRFHVRRNNQNVTYDTSELRAAFQQSEQWAARARRFRDGRLAQILSDELPIPRLAEPRIVVHLVPLGTPFDRPWVNFDALPKGEPRYLSGREIPRSDRFNMDGLVHSFGGPDCGVAYVQFFRDGALEAVTSILTNSDNGTFKLDDVRRYSEQLITFYLRALVEAGAELPFAVLLSLLGFRGLQPEVPHPKVKADRDVYTLPDVLIEDIPPERPESLKRLFDVLWQTFGFPEIPTVTDAAQRREERAP